MGRLPPEVLEDERVTTLNEARDFNLSSNEEQLRSMIETVKADPNGVLAAPAHPVEADAPVAEEKPAPAPPARKTRKSKAKVAA